MMKQQCCSWLLEQGKFILIEQPFNLLLPVHEWWLNNVVTTLLSWLNNIVDSDQHSVVHAGQLNLVHDDQLNLDTWHIVTTKNRSTSAVSSTEIPTSYM